METPENLATHGTQDDGKKQKNKKTTQYVLTPLYANKQSWTTT